jgi:glycosyltransferase involved in cell wall biosynthesis
MSRFADFLMQLFRPSKYYFRKLRTELQFLEQRLDERLALIGADGAIFSQASIREAGFSQGRIAVVAPLPPAQTGIAYATLNTFAPWSKGVDFFGAFSTAAELNLAQYHDALAGTSHRVFHIDFLPEAIARLNYDAVIFAFGNSAHNVRVVSWLLRMREFADRPAVFAYVHDPVVLNVLRKTSMAMGHSFDELFRRSYDRRALALFRKSATDTLVSQGVTGMRALRRESGVDAILVNSLAAKTLLLADDPRLQADQVGLLFHPVFAKAPAPRRAENDGESLRIGCFGVLSSDKQPGLVLDAVRQLRDRGVNARLIIAGYEINGFVAANDLEALDFVDLYQNLGDSELIELMQSVDVAVQLRGHNTGETSGAVSMLIGAGTPTIVSRIGAFEEFADAVAFVPPGCSPATLADAILAARADAAAGKDRMAAFAAQRTPWRFCAELARFMAPLTAAQEIVPKVAVGRGERRI